MSGFIVKREPEHIGGGFIIFKSSSVHSGLIDGYACREKIHVTVTREYYAACTPVDTTTAGIVRVKYGDTLPEKFNSPVMASPERDTVIAWTGVPCR